jgi:hypothetical protein
MALNMAQKLVDVRRREDAERLVTISLNGVANPPHSSDKTGSLRYSNSQMRLESPRLRWMMPVKEGRGKREEGRGILAISRARGAALMCSHVAASALEVCVVNSSLGRQTHTSNPACIA